MFHEDCPTALVEHVGGIERGDQNTGVEEVHRSTGVALSADIRSSIVRLRGCALDHQIFSDFLEFSALGRNWPNLDDAARSQSDDGWSALAQFGCFADALWEDGSANGIDRNELFHLRKLAFAMENGKSY